MDLVTKVVKETLLGATGASSSSSSSSSADAVAPPPPSPASVLAQAADVGASIEAALFKEYGYADPAKPGPEYAEHFRTLAMGLPRNGTLVLNVFTGDLPVGELVKYTGDQLVSDEAKRKAEEIREQQ